MAMLDPFAPIPVRRKIKDIIPVIYKNKIGYVVEKISFIDEHLNDVYYKLLFLEINMKNKKPIINISTNNFDLFSDDFYITFMPEGELITNKNIKQFSIPLIKTFPLIKYSKNRINLRKKEKKFKKNLFSFLKEFLFKKSS